MTQPQDDEDVLWAHIVESLRRLAGERSAVFTVAALVDHGESYDRWYHAEISATAIGRAAQAPEDSHEASLCLDLYLDVTRATVEENASKIGEMLTTSEGELLPQEDRQSAGLEFLSGALTSGGLLTAQMDYDNTLDILQRSAITKDQALQIFGTRGVHAGALTKALVRGGMSESVATQLAGIIMRGVGAAADEIATVSTARAEAMASALVAASMSADDEEADDEDEDDDGTDAEKE